MRQGRKTTGLNISICTSDYHKIAGLHEPMQPGFLFVRLKTHSATFFAWMKNDMKKEIAMKRVVSYFLIFLFVVTFYGCNGGNGSSSPSQREGADGFVTLSAETLAGPNGIIVYSGEEYYSEVDVPSNAIVGVIKGGEPYIYHPALGDLELTEETSKQALAHFVVGENDFVHGERPLADNLMMQQFMSRILKINDFETVELDTGLRIGRYDRELRIRNDYNRWAAVKVTDNLDTRVFFIPPRARILDSNYIRFMAEDPTFQALGTIAEMFTQESELIITVDPPAKIETFGAVFRGQPYYMYGPWPAGSVESLYSDKDLVLQLNLIDMTYLLYEGLNHINQLKPISCLNWITGWMLDMIKAELLGYLTVEERIATYYYREMAQNFSVNFLSCLISVPSYLVSETLMFFWNLATSLDYFVEDILVQDAALFQKAAYAVAEIEGPLMINVLAAPDRLNLREPGIWEIELVGGTPPFNINVEWGDGQSAYYHRESQRLYSLTCSYEIYQPETYEINITVIDRTGERGSKVLNVSVSDEISTALSAVFTDDSPMTLEAGALGKFYVHSMNVSRSASAEIDWGDGSSPLILETPYYQWMRTWWNFSAEHTYIRTGRKTVTATITDEDGETATATWYVEVIGSTENCVDISGRWNLKLTTVLFVDGKPKEPEIKNAIGDIYQTDCEFTIGHNSGVISDYSHVELPVSKVHDQDTQIVTLTGLAQDDSIILDAETIFQTPFGSYTYLYQYEFTRID